MRYKIGICDDDASQREFLAEIVAAWARKGHRLAEVRQYSDARAFLFEYAEEKDFDILLLDIEMPEVSGIELAKTVRRDNTAVQIVFVTGYYEYFSDGFDVSALHYLVKPVDAGKLMPVLDRAAGNLSYRQRCVLVSTPDAEVKLPLGDIVYVEAENVYVLVHTVRATYRTRSTLAKFTGQLDETFYKVHRSYVVSLRYIMKITRSSITVTGGDQIPISRGMYDQVHAALVRYL